MARRSLFIATALVVAFAPRLFARRQASPPDLASAVRTQVTTARLEQDARAIVEPERLSGSAGENAAIDYIVRTLRTDGVPVSVDTFLAYTSDPVSASLTLLAENNTNAIVAPFSPKAITVAFSKSAHDLTGRAVDIGDASVLPDFQAASLERLALVGAPAPGMEREPTPATGRPQGGSAPTAPDRAALGRLRGAIAIVTGTPGPDEAWALQQLGAIGAVFVNPDERLNDLVTTTVWGTPSLRDRHRIPELPVVEIKKSDGVELRKLLAATPSLLVRLSAETRTGWKPLRLAVARIPAGATGNADAPYVLFGGHIDAWYHGGTDEGASNAAMLELARAFYRERARMRRGLVVAWWPGHSNGRYAGSTWFVDHHFAELRDRAIAYLNVDGIGQTGAKTFSAAATASLGGLAADVVRTRTGTANTRVGRPGRDSDQSFNGVGLPLLQLNHNRLEQDGGYWWWHTPDDTFDKIDFQVLKVDADLYADAIAALVGAPVPPIDVASEVAALGALLQQRQKMAATRLDLSASITRQEKLLDLVRRLQPLWGKASTGDPALAMVRLLRPVHRVVYTLGSSYHPDPAVAFGQLPGLADVRTLGATSPESDDARFAEATLVREQNRLIDALDQAIREAQLELNRRQVSR